MAAYVELYIDQGTDFRDIISINDDVNGIAANLSGYTITGQLRRSYYSANVSANITCNISNSANGEVTISMNSGVTANLRAGRYVFDVKAVDSSNNTSRFLEGIITISPQVTR
jgi:hypothetical protein